MGKKIFFLIMLLLLIAMFGVLYFIGITNLFFEDSVFLKTFQFLDFDSSMISFFYLFILSIFFVVMVTIMVKMLITPNDGGEKKPFIPLPEQMTVEAPPELIKKITDISCSTIYQENEKRFIMLMEDTLLQERLDDLYYRFSQMIADLSEVQTALELFEKTIYWGTKLSGSKRGSVMIVDREYLTVYKTVGWKEEEKEKTEEIRVPIGTRISGIVASEKRFFVINNIEEYTNYDFPDRNRYETIALVSFPIVTNGRSIAVLNFTENSKRGYYSVGEHEILRVLFIFSNRMYEFLQIKKKIERM